MSGVTLVDLFSELEGQHFPNRQAFEDAVLVVFNRHIGDLPIGYSYKDAIEGARSRGWLDPNGCSGVTVRLGKDRPLVAG